MLHTAQDALVGAAAFLFVLGLVVTIHEMGHFLAAKACGVAGERFSIGFGQALVSWRDRAGVEWRIAWIPLGGYVKFAGDEDAASVPDAEDLEILRREVLAREGPEALRRYFHFKPVWQRAIVVAAGPLANFVLAIVLTAGLLMSIGESTLPARVERTKPGEPAAVAGFQPGDLIERADGKTIDSFESLQLYVKLRAGTPIRFVVLRNGHETTLNATPVLRDSSNGLGVHQMMGQLGFYPYQRPSDVVYKRFGPVQALGAGVTRTWDALGTTVFIVNRLIHGQLPMQQLSGPLGIAQMSGAVVHAGTAGEPNFGLKLLGALTNLLTLAAMLSVSIGFMNLLPVPVLDGGHLLFYAFEAAARRPLGAKLQAAGFRVGLALLLGLMLFATWNDLQRLRVFKLLGGFFS